MTIFWIIVIGFIVFGFGPAMLIKRSENRKKEYYLQCLQQVKLHPNEPSLVRDAVAAGRVYYAAVNSMRSSKINSEVAIQNDVRMALGKSL